MSEEVRALQRQIDQMRAQMQRLESASRHTWAHPVSAQADVSKTCNAVAQASHGFTVGQVIRHNGTAWVLAQADTAANAAVGGIVAVVTGTGTFIVATGGYVTGLSGLTSGSVHYLSDATAGALTTTAPTIAIPIILADSATSGALQSFWAGGGGGGVAPTEDGTVFCSNSGGTAGEWVLTVDIGRNATSKSGKLQLLSPNAAGVAVEIDASLVAATSKKLTIREVDVCEAGVAMKMLVLCSAPY